MIEYINNMNTASIVLNPTYPDNTTEIIHVEITYITE